LTYPVGSRSANFITISDDYVAWDFVRLENHRQYRRGCSFLDTESMEFKEIPVFCHCEQSIHCYHLDETLMFWKVVDSTKKLEIVDPDNRWVVNVLEGFNEGEADEVRVQVAFGSGFLVTYFHPFPESFVRERNWESFRIWKMGNPPILLKSRTSKFRNLKLMKVDEKFIVASKNVWSTTLYFISTKTLEETRFVPLSNDDYVYNRGLLFASHDNVIVRILDVTSTGHYHDVRLPIRKEEKESIQLLDTWASSNSKFMVIGWKSSTMCGTCSHLSVYDLVKKRNSDPGSHLLYTLQFQFNIDSFVMNESEIAFNGKDGNNNRSVTVLKFANFGFVERKTPVPEDSPETNENVKMTIIYDFNVDCDFLPIENRERGRTIKDPLKVRKIRNLETLIRMAN
jgi:hypothetical protein